MGKGIDTKQRIIDIACIYLATFISCIPNDMLTLLISVKVKQHVSNDMLISFIFTAQIIAGILFARYIPDFVKKFGMINSIHIASITAAFIAVIFYFYINYLLWIAFTFIFGTCLFSFVAIRQNMLFDLSPDKHKAILSSIGGMFVALGISFGALLMKFIPHEGISPHLLASLFYLLSTLPMVFIKGCENNIKKVKKIGLLRYIYNSPKIMFGGFSFNYANASVQSFLIIYGLGKGMNAAQASLLFSILLFGTVFSIPIGFITDRVNRRFVMLSCTIISLILACLIPLSYDLEVTYALLFLMFGFSFGIKLPALILINEKYKPTQRLAVVSSFNKMCLIGSVCGVICTGLFMKSLGPVGLWMSVISILFSYLLFSIANYLYKFAYGKPVVGKFFINNDISTDFRKVIYTKL